MLYLQQIYSKVSPLSCHSRLTGGQLLGRDPFSISSQAVGLVGSSHAGIISIYGDSIAIIAHIRKDVKSISAGIECATPIWPGSSAMSDAWLS